VRRHDALVVTALGLLIVCSGALAFLWWANGRADYPNIPDPCGAVGNTVGLSAFFVFLVTGLSLVVTIVVTLMALLRRRDGKRALLWLVTFLVAAGVTLAAGGVMGNYGTYEGLPPQGVCGD
jgi:drug/metabolite transporter (DMT)-like permease